MRLERFSLNKLSRRDVSMMLAGAAIVLVLFGINSLMQSSHTPLQPRSSAITSRWIPATVKHWQEPIGAMAQRYDIDPNLIAIIMTLESGGDPKADSGQAHGLMQITPPTAKEIAAKHLKEPKKSYDIWKPETNVEFGAAYLAYLRDTFGAPEQGPSWNTTVELIAAGYNGGPAAALSVQEGKGLRDPQTVIYSRDAFNMWRERNAAKSPTYDRWLERGGSELIKDAQKK